MSRSLNRLAYPLCTVFSGDARWAGTSAGRPAVARRSSLVSLRLRHRSKISGAVTFLLSACHHGPPAAATSIVGGRECPAGALNTSQRGGIVEADSSLTQARVRWAVADLLAKVNSGDVTELSVRYDWAGSVTERDQFFAVAKRPMSVKVLALDSSAPWWSDAPGRRQQAICVTLSVFGTNAGGVTRARKVALRSSVLDDGRVAWLSRLQVVELAQ